MNENLSPEEIKLLVTAYQSSKGLEPDGIAGPLTRAKLAEQLFIKGDIRRPPVDRWPAFHGPIYTPVANRSAAYATFGNPGSGKPSQKWVAENIVELHHSHGNQIEQIPSKFYFKTHTLAEPYIREAHRRAALACPDYTIERAASYVFRHMRHDPSMPLSDHAFGAAEDIDPHKNHAKYFKRGEAPKAWSPEWMKIWPDGLPQAFVEAYKSVGFIWGADWDGDDDTSDHIFIDPMHFTLVRPG